MILKMVPVYWMYEQTGKMNPIVTKFFNDEELTTDELNTLRWYIHQWASAMVCCPVDIKRVFQMSQKQLKAYNFDVLLCEYSIDPF